MRRTSSASVLALACVLPALADEQVRTDRFLVVLDQRADRAVLDALEKRLSTAYRARTVSRITEGALLGLLVSLDIGRADELRGEKSVASVVQVETPPWSAVSQPSDRFQRAPRGWAIPGLYNVILHDKWGFGLELPPGQQNLTGVAKREALRERREVLVREAAEQMAAQYGGAVRGSSSWEAPMFSCAMTEEAALRMVADERVWRVQESPYAVIDDPLPGDELLEPSPAPTPWRP